MIKTVPSEAYIEWLNLYVLGSVVMLAKFLHQKIRGFKVCGFGCGADLKNCRSNMQFQNSSQAALLIYYGQEEAQVPREGMSEEGMTRMFVGVIRCRSWSEAKEKMQRSASSCSQYIIATSTRKDLYPPRRLHRFNVKDKFKTRLSLTTCTAMAKSQPPT
jgi:hypothetical protein